MYSIFGVEVSAPLFWLFHLIGSVGVLVLALYLAWGQYVAAFPVAILAAGFFFLDGANLGVRMERPSVRPTRGTRATSVEMRRR